MKLFAIILVLSCAAFSAERPAVSVTCNSCHVPHQAQGEVNDLLPASASPQASACISCHDGQVVDNPHLTGEPIPVRTNLNSPFTQNNSPTPRFMSVTLSEAERQICTKCHEPHSAHFSDKKGTTLPSYHQSMKDNTRCMACHKST